MTTDVKRLESGCNRCTFLFNRRPAECGPRLPSSRRIRATPTVCLPRLREPRAVLAPHTWSPASERVWQAIRSKVAASSQGDRITTSCSEGWTAISAAATSRPQTLVGHEPMRDRVFVDGREEMRNVGRDYWVALSEHAGVLWVFQNRLGDDEAAWFLHGTFA